jgi:transcriptional regulator with XRE-family HTH domain
MAEALGMSPSGYSKIERAETSPTIDKIQEIALLLGIDMMTLIAENEVQKNEPSDELKEIKEQYRKLENMLAIIVKEVNTLKKKMQEQEQE